MDRIYLSIGTNKGNREKNLQTACKRLADVVVNMVCSSVYATKAMYLEKQPDFLNMVIKGSTGLSSEDLLKNIHLIELSLGRNRSDEVLMGPRSLDIDILLYGNQILKSEHLVVPHPRIKERQFVLIPLLEIEPGLRDPVTGELYSIFLQKLPDQGVVLNGPAPCF